MPSLAPRPTGASWFLSVGICDLSVESEFLERLRFVTRNDGFGGIFLFGYNPRSRLLRLYVLIAPESSHVAWVCVDMPMSRFLSWHYVVMSVVRCLKEKLLALLY